MIVFIQVVLYFPWQLLKSHQCKHDVFLGCLDLPLICFASLLDGFKGGSDPGDFRVDGDSRVC